MASKKSTSRSANSVDLIEKVILGKSASMAVVLDPEGRILRSCPVLEKSLGYASSQLVGKNLFELMTGFDKESAQAAFRKLKPQSQPYRKLNQFLTRKGQVCHLYCDLSVVQNKNGKVDCVAGTVVDMTEIQSLDPLEIRDQEMNRIGQDIHDGLGQHLTSIAFLAKGLQRKLETQGKIEAAELDDLVAMANEATKTTNHILHGLFPVELNSDGLAKALSYLTDRTEKIFGIKCHFNNNQSSPIWEYELALPFFRIAQEAVNNAVKHSEATQIDINLINSDDRLTMTILDNGKGLPAAQKMKNGIGMHTMGFRATAIGATLKIENAKQGGTVVICDLLAPNNRSSYEKKRPKG